MSESLLRKELHYGRRIVRTYVKRPRSVSDIFQMSLSLHATAEAVVEGESRITYLNLSQQVQAVAAGLQLNGIKKGDRIALMCGNRTEFIITLLACAIIGAVTVPIGIRLQTQEIEYICNHSGASILIHEASLSNTLPISINTPQVRQRFSVGGLAQGSLDFSKLSAEGTDFKTCDVEDDDLFLIAYTSGTTGRPKGAMVTHLCAVHACMNWAKALGTDATETAILAIPASHIGGTAGVILPILYLGGKIVLMWEFRTEPFLKLAEKERMTYGVFVPAIYNLCLLTPTFLDFDLSSWRWGVFSGAPMPEATIRRMQAALPKLKMVSAYGATEATSAIAIMPPDEGSNRLDCVGRTVECGDTIVMGEDDIELPLGQVGELWIAGPMVVSGYWADEEATEAGFKNGYWKSGDIGSVDDHGYLRVFDRRKEMINRGGMKVFSAEVENILNEHPDIVEVAVLGHPDPVLGERVRAIIVSKVLIDINEIQQFCRVRLADYKTPELITIRELPLPRNSNGKVLKRLLATEGDATCPVSVKTS